MQVQENSTTVETVKPQRRCRRWCSRTCIIIAVGVILFLISAAVAGIIASAVKSGEDYIARPFPHSFYFWLGYTISL